jgi:hypothetical protein
VSKKCFRLFLSALWKNKRHGYFMQDGVRAYIDIHFINVSNYAFEVRHRLCPVKVSRLTSLIFSSVGKPNE